MKNEKETQTTENSHEFNIQRIYAKDISFEAPNIPEIFKIEWAPQVDLDLQTKSQKISDTIYEVVLHVTVTVKLQDKVAFLIEIKQAGIFTLQGFDEEQLKHMLGSFCPNILFPYARELVSETICRGSFPPLYLAPINFEALYQEQQSQNKNRSAANS